MKFLFTEKDIDSMIESVLAEAKAKWGTNDNVKQYIEEGEVARQIVAYTVEENAPDMKK